MNTVDYLQKKDRGVTMMEYLLVMGIFLIVLALGLFVTVDSYLRYIYRSDRDMLVSALQRARSESMLNICLGDNTTCTDGRPHGVKVLSSPNRIVVFQGSSYDSRDQNHDFTIAVSQRAIFSGDDEVVFTQLSGDISSTKQIVIQNPDNNRTDTVSISTIGQINW